MDDGSFAACLGIFLLVAVAGWIAGKKKSRVEIDPVEEAQFYYQQTLEQLKSNPYDPNIKQMALKLGRKYSSLTRDAAGAGKSVTIYDEMALMNDLNAATAAANRLSPMPSQQYSQPPGGYGHSSGPLPPPTSVADRLRMLNDLRSQGLISDQEYTERRTKILGEL